MPFEILPPDETALNSDPLAAEIDTDARPSAAYQLSLLRHSEAQEIDVSPTQRRPKPSLQDIQTHITHLSGQLETLRRQLRDHPADRLAMLLREMIEERERELERWLAQERRWDERLATIEHAIVERDLYRQREADLVRERDAARREAQAAEARLEAVHVAAEQAKRKAAALERTAEKAQAEQLRLRQERELDRSAWISERRQLSAKVEQLQDRGWLSRIIRG